MKTTERIGIEVSQTEQLTVDVLTISWLHFYNLWNSLTFKWATLNTPQVLQRSGVPCKECETETIISSIKPFPNVIKTNKNS